MPGGLGRRFSFFDILTWNIASVSEDQSVVGHECRGHRGSEGMKDLIEKALVYQEFAATRSNAYYGMADFCRRSHMRLGVVATIASTLVGTAVFAGLATRANSNNSAALQSLGGWGLVGFLIVALFSISAPVLTGLQTFLKYSEQAEKHKVTAVGYDLLRQRLDLFMLRFRDAPDASRDAALKHLEEIVGEFGRIAEGSLTISDNVYDKAVLKRRARAAGSV